VKTHALKRDTITTDVERQVRTLASGATTTTDVYPAIQYMLATLRDGHSDFWSAAGWARFIRSGPENPEPSVQALEGRVGYINMPGYGGGERELLRAYASRLHQLLEETQSSASCGWVVDLRGNDGGNVHPMLAGLKPFLGDTPLGTSVGPDGPMEPSVAGRHVDVEPAPALKVLERLPVAILIGPRTTSAGEGVTLAFRGRPRTRTFGQPTNGRTTAVGPFKLPDGSVLALAAAVMADRTGRTYGGKIEPDDLVQGSGSAVNPSLDATRAVAVAWLKQNSTCQ
jgi:carboxyl-terminal processing protease